MPAGGKRIGAGRRKGSIGKATEAVLSMLARLGCSPLEGLAQISLRRVSCGTCVDEKGEPTGVTRYALPEGKHAKTCKAPVGEAHMSAHCTCSGIAERTCLSCFGTLRERIGADLKFKADAELAQYVAPKRKAVEVSGPEGGPVERRLELVFIEAKDGKRA